MPIRQQRRTITEATRIDRRTIERLEPADLFDAWMFAEADATLAIAAWRGAPHEEKGEAYATYVAAFERETQAARVLELRLSLG